MRTGVAPADRDRQAGARRGLDQSLVGTIPRKGGTKQATLNGWPLYYFAGDAGPGEHNRQGKFGVWWEVTPAGAAFKG